MIQERRAIERMGTEIKAKYHVKDLFKDAEFDCLIIDATEDGAGIRTEAEETPFGTKPKGGLKPGSNIHLLLNEMNIPCKVIYVEMSSVGLKFDKNHQNDIEAIKKMLNQ